jgi:hypothetical protein
MWHFSSSSCGSYFHYPQWWCILLLLQIQLQILEDVPGYLCYVHHTDQCMDVMEQHLNIVHRNQDIIHNQRDGPFLDFPDVLVYPPVPDPYASLTPTELAAFGIGPSRSPVDSDDEEEEANDDEGMEDDE